MGPSWESMQSDTKEGATTVLTETDMVAGLTATSGRKCVLVSRDHPSISGFMAVDGRGILLHSHGWVREDHIRVRPPRRLFPATPKKRLSGCFFPPHGFRARRTGAIGSPETHVGEGSSSSTCLLSTPHRVTSKSARSLGEG